MVAALTIVSVLAMGALVNTASVLAVSPTSTPPPTSQPFDLDTLITDRAEVLEGVDRARLVHAISELRDEHGVQLYIAYAESFSGIDATQWANDTAVANGLDDDDVLYAVAVEDRRYGWSVAQGFPVPDSELAAIFAASEPLLAGGQWADAGIAAADGIREALDSAGETAVGTESTTGPRHEFEMTLIPDGWTSLITIEAGPAVRPGDLPQSVAELDGCAPHPERDLVVPLTLTQTNPTGFSDSPQYHLQLIGDVDGIVELSTATDCFDLVNAAMSSRVDLTPGDTSQSRVVIVLREHFAPAHPDGDAEAWADAVLQFLPGDDWITEHGGDVDNPSFDVQLVATTLGSTVSPANEIPLPALLPDTSDG